MNNTGRIAASVGDTSPPYAIAAKTAIVDVSYTTTSNALKGLEAWGVNARMAVSGQSEAWKYSAAMRTLYSGGQYEGKGNEALLFEELLAGKANIREDKTARYGAVTTLDDDRNRLITLGGDSSAYRDGLGLGVILSHEAYRDGIVSDAVAQRSETDQAAFRHMQTAMLLEGTYGAGSLGGYMSDEAKKLSDAYQSGDFSQVAKAMAGYDSSSDYWKLMKDGTLVNDGMARLLVEITSDAGKQDWHLVEGSDKETSVAAALVHYLGEDRALELLGGSLALASNYDDQTLHDVLNLDDTDIRLLRNNPSEAARFILSATDLQRQKLLGEALMKDAGITWSDKAGWVGDGSKLTLTDSPIHGDAAMRSIGGNAYERFSITAEIERRAGAYDVWKDGVKGDLGTGNTRVSFTKWDIDTGEQIATLIGSSAWNSVDNSFGQPSTQGVPIGEDQPYQILFGPTLQGNTIAAGSLDLRWAQAQQPTWGDVFILANTHTISGDSIGIDGRRPKYPREDRWLMHYTNFGSSDGCIVSGSKKPYVQLMSSLKTWGLYQGYSISGELNDDNDFPYRFGYKKGK